MHVWEWALGWIIGTKKVIDKPGLQYRIEENHLHHNINEDHLHYRHDGESLHYRVSEEQ